MYTRDVRSEFGPVQNDRIICLNPRPQSRSHVLYKEKIEHLTALLPQNRSCRTQISISLARSLALRTFGKGNRHFRSYLNINQMLIAREKNNRKNAN